MKKRVFRPGWGCPFGSTPFAQEEEKDLPNGGEPARGRENAEIKI